MRIAAYYQRIRLWNPTGVGKHIANVTRILSSELGSVDHIHAFDDYVRSRKLKVPGVMAPDKLCLLPLPRKAIEIAWAAFSYPPIEWFSEKYDWIYCPAEYYVRCRKARLAVTVHCENWFNDELPWYHHADTSLVRRKRSRLYEIISQKADRILCVSEFLKERMIKTFKVPERKTFVVGNGVEEAFFTPAAPPEELKRKIAGRPYACIVGGLTRRKGADATLKIIREMESKFNCFLFVIVGTSEPPFQGQLEHCDNVIQAGYVGVNTGLPGLLAEATAVLFLSRYETFGIPAIEAMAAGTLPIVSDFGALPELVNGNGIVLKESQYMEVPHILTDLVSHPPGDSGRESLRSRAREFTWQACCERIKSALVQ